MCRGELARAAALLLLTAGCGGGSSTGSVCDKVVQGYKDYSSKASACGVTIPLGERQRLHRGRQGALGKVRKLPQRAPQLHHRQHDALHQRGPRLHGDAQQRALTGLPVTPAVPGRKLRSP